MKILHIMTFRRPSSGVFNQMRDELLCAKQIDGHEWDNLIFHGGAVEGGNQKCIPAFLNKGMLRSLLVWLYMVRNWRRYDYILCRHMSCDPWCLMFGWFVPNRLSVHHSKEMEEIFSKGRSCKRKVLAGVARVTGAISLLQCKGIIGVTPELAEYEQARIPFARNQYIYPNGIRYDDSQSVWRDGRDADDVNVLFMCSHFNVWHGLDLLIEAARANDVKARIIFHLVGEIPEGLMKQINAYESPFVQFKEYGRLSRDEYQLVAEKCDMGLSSLALERNGMKEACTLKTREYLRFGLPVYAGHYDSGISEEFLFFRKGPVCVNSMVAYAKELKEYSRQDVSIAAKPEIDKQQCMRELLKQISAS